MFTFHVCDYDTHTRQLEQDGCMKVSRFVSADKYHRLSSNVFHIISKKENTKDYVLFNGLNKNDLLVACVSGAYLRRMTQEIGSERVVLVVSFYPVKRD